MKKRFLQTLSKRVQSLRLFPLLVCLGFLIPAVSWGQTGNWSDQAGNATEGTDYVKNEKVYTIKTPLGLAWIASQIDGYGKLDGETKYTVNIEADLDMGAYIWTPIKVFNGTFNGQNHVIRNVSISGANSEIGFIGRLSNNGSTILNVTLENVSVKDIDWDSGSNYSIGTLLGRFASGYVENSHATGSIQAEDPAEKSGSYGGLIGSVSSDAERIIKCTSDVDITVTDNAGNAYGGLLGWLDSQKIIVSSCKASGNINVTIRKGHYANEDEYIGGLIGRVDKGKVLLNNMSCGDITCKIEDGTTTYHPLNFYVGGLIGGKNKLGTTALNITLANCVSKSNIQTYIPVDLQQKLNNYTNTFVGSLGEDAELNLDNCFYTEHTGMGIIGEQNSLSGIGVVPTGEGELDKALNDWIDQYTGEYKDKGYLLKWKNGELVQEKIPEEGVDYEWNDDHTECTILTPEGLLWLSEQVVTVGNDFEGNTVILDKHDNDYWNLSDIEWKPIGSESKSFKGMFDGQFQTVTIKKMKDGEYCGFFGYVEGGTIRNLIVNANDLNVSQNKVVGIVVHTIEGGTIDHVKSMGKAAIINATTSIGGITNTAKNTTFANCINEAVLSNSWYSGGICVVARETCQFLGCYNIGELAGNPAHDAAICVDITNEASKVENCAYLEGSASRAVETEEYNFPAHTEDQFANGTVTFLLGNAYGQRIGTDKYPVWMATIPAEEQAIYKVYSVTLDYGIEGQENVPIYYNAGATLPEPGDREGYIFEGWYDQETGGNKIESLPTDGTSPIYAHWRKITYSITLVQTVGGTISVDKQTAAKDETVTLTATPNVEYVFKAWQITPETVTIDENNTFIMPESDVTVTAIFEKEEDPEPPVDPISYYNIYVEDVCDGVEVSTSKNVVREGGSVSVYVEKDTANYTFDNFKVYYKRSYYGTWNELKEGTQPGEYPVNNIWTHIYIKALGAEEKEDPTGIESIEGVKVYTKDGSLYVQTPQREQVIIVSMSGAVVKNEEQIGLKQYYGLQPGIYIVRVGDRAYKVRLN